MQNNDFIIPAQTEVTRLVQLFQTNGVTPATGLTITDLDLTYKQSWEPVSTKVDATALSLVDDGHSANKMIEVDGTNMPGVYRVDWPDAAFELVTTIHTPEGWRRQPLQVALTIKGAAIQAHTEILQLYRPPGLIHRGRITTDTGASPYFTWLDSGAGHSPHPTGALVVITPAKFPQESYVRQVTGLGSTGSPIRLDNDITSDIEDNGGGIADLIAVPDGNFVGQNPFVLYEGTVTVTDQTTLVLDDRASAIDDIYNGLLVLCKDADHSDPVMDSKYTRVGSVRICTDYTGSSTTLKINRAPDFTIATGDHVIILATVGIASETTTHGKAVAGTLSTTQMTTDLSEATDNHFNGRLLLWTSGALRNEARAIKDYQGSNKMLSFTAATEAPAAGDAFVIV